MAIHWSCVTCPLTDETFCAEACKGYSNVQRYRENEKHKTMIVIPPRSSDDRQQSN